MTRFKTGQQVVCIKEGKYFNHKYQVYHSTGPKYGDIVTVTGYSSNDHEYLFLLEWPTSINNTATSWKEINFKELMDISELTEILEEKEMACFIPGPMTKFGK